MYAFKLRYMYHKHRCRINGVEPMRYVDWQDHMVRCQYTLWAFVKYTVHGFIWNALPLKVRSKILYRKVLKHSVPTVEGALNLDEFSYVNAKMVEDICKAYGIPPGDLK